ncbi:MAG: squalene/phytoene synthase family protein [Alphaproteobacteria bacterium GM202ARS2]|nr:squalene/phytoene synthase family protein [Alphaproteobacteria bacterium GM202ARS2]
MTQSDWAYASGKYAGDENFPVGSFLLRRGHRSAVALYYRFARFSDDIADHGGLAAADKIKKLRYLDDALCGRHYHEVAEPVRLMMIERGIPLRHARDLLVAFQLDATKRRYRDWADLRHYCLHSAAPVGRFVLDLHGEESALYGSSDALCNALQVINHIQDCVKDYRVLHRIYMPSVWSRRAGADEKALLAGRADRAWRQVFDEVLQHVEVWLDEAAVLSTAVQSRRLSMEVAVVYAVARRLVKALRSEHPLVKNIALSRWAYAGCFVEGVLRGRRRVT